MKGPNAPAFARPASETRLWETVPSSGLTKREYFAAMALAGLSANPATPIERIGEMAVRRADAVLAELAQGGQE